MRTGLAALKAGLDVETALLNGGTAEVRTGAAPATPAGADSGVKLGTCGLNAVAFAASVTSVNDALAVANAITDDADADATGTMGHVRCKTVGGVVVYDFPAADVTMNNADIQIHGRVRITGLSVKKVM